MSCCRMPRLHCYERNAAWVRGWCSIGFEVYVHARGVRAAHVCTAKCHARGVVCIGCAQNISCPHLIQSLVLFYLFAVSTFDPLPEFGSIYSPCSLDLLSSIDFPCVCMPCQSCRSLAWLSTSALPGRTLRLRIQLSERLHPHL